MVGHPPSPTQPGVQDKPQALLFLLPLRRNTHRNFWWQGFSANQKWEKRREGRDGNYQVAKEGDIHDQEKDWGGDPEQHKSTFQKGSGGLKSLTAPGAFGAGPRVMPWKEELTGWPLQGGGGCQ